MGDLVRVGPPRRHGVSTDRIRGRKSAEVRFYVDADLLGLAKVLTQVRSDVTYPGDPGGDLHRSRRPPCPIEDPGVKDPVWIPQVAALSWVIITRDSAIQGHARETAAVYENGARMVALAGTSAKTKFDQLESTMSRWRDIQRCVDEPGPFIYIATRTTFRAFSRDDN